MIFIGELTETGEDVETPASVKAIADWLAGTKC